MKAAAIALCSAILVLVTSEASFAFTTKNQMRVNPVDAAVWEVVPRRATSGEEIWCAAADFVNRGLRRPWNTEIFVFRGRGPSVTTGRVTAVQFTIDPDAAGIEPTEPGLLLNAFRVGDHMSADRARVLCQLGPRIF